MFFHVSSFFACIVRFWNHILTTVLRYNAQYKIKGENLQRLNTNYYKTKYNHSEWNMLLPITVISAVSSM